MKQPAYCKYLLHMGLQVCGAHAQLQFQCVLRFWLRETFTSVASIANLFLNCHTTFCSRITIPFAYFKLLSQEA